MLQGLDDAAAVRDQILDRVKRTRSAGLGDERATRLWSRRTAARSRVVRRASAVLREISETARRLAGNASGL
jgi:Cdc6-like AAA superfamily ATPase